MSFADSFWTQDYESGFNVLFEQLYEGIYEDEDFIHLFTARMDSEHLYGTQLNSISTQKSASTRYNNDDHVSSMKNSFQKMNENFGRQGDYHVQVASNIRQMVLEPFSQWCKEHKQRVEYSESTLLDKHKQFRAARAQLEKLQKRYFNKCRMLEEFKAHYTEEELAEETRDAAEAELHAEEEAAAAANTSVSEDDDTGRYHFGNATYDTPTLKQLLIDLVQGVERKSHKVAILGTYHNVSTGSDITQWLLDNMEEFNRSIAKAETFGQDLVAQGFIRLIGSMGGKNFINSSQFHYQWKPIVFQMTGINENGPTNDQSVTGDNNNNTTTAAAAHNNNKNSANIAAYLEDMKQAIGVNTVDFNDRSQYTRLMTDVSALDAKYYEATVALDKQRCEFEELIMDHLTFMQKCELDRMKAVKKATFDFLGCMSNKVAAMKSTCEELLVLEETINPVNDLKFLIENYATGRFKPNVVLYDNYYDSNVKQTFGVDLAVKSRLDRKVVPVIIQCILSHLDKQYPDLTDDEERVNLWTKPVHLSEVHQLRFALNDETDPNKINEALDKTSPLVITNLFKLYLMELPDSIIPWNYYDLIKSLYSNYPPSESTSVNDSRINGLQNVLVDLPKCNIATLDALLTHLTRLIHIIGSKNDKLASEFQNKLSREFGTLVLRPKIDASSNTDSYLNDKHQFNFLSDLFEHKDRIFTELRRRSSTRVASGSNHPSGNGRSKTQSPTTSLKKTASKNRLESRLQHAVSKTAKKEDSKQTTEAEETAPVSTELPSLPSTPISSTSSLKRSTSPNKKKLSESPGRSRPVSSRPAKKDVIFDGNNSSYESIKESGQPKFAPSLGRKTSVKDLASRFDSTSPEKRDRSPDKKAAPETIVVD
ncbi:rho-GTPase-activating protein Rgd2p [[Candida] anglica]|uniref:Rho-GTPase-activating protein Rgd2p n=1 Tax=[Candida] anglica TaxID=148631 RepID=A0ABP0EE97_9ASCO